MRDERRDLPAEPIRTGVEDKFHYVISDSCVMCGACEAECPVGAARRSPYIRESISVRDIDWSKCYFNPGCALSLYKPEVPPKMLALLRERFGDVKLHSICCRHDPKLEAGSTIINNCAGCDRRFRSLYEGIQTISYWEVIDGVEGLELPDHSGLTVSVHDSCGYRHKPRVHRAVRSLLRKMNVEIMESAFSGTESVCCGDNFYGAVPNEQVERRIRMRADQFPCQDVVVYCIGCVRAMTAGGKTPRYLPNLLLDRTAEPMPDTLDEYHSRLVSFSSRLIKK